MAAQGSAAKILLLLSRPIESKHPGRGKFGPSLCGRGDRRSFISVRGVAQRQVFRRLEGEIMYMLAEFFFFFAVALVLGALVFAVVATVFIVKEGCALAIR